MTERLRVERDGGERVTVWIGDMPIRWAKYHETNLLLSGDAVFRSRRVVVPFESGWQVSIIWGTDTYSDYWTGEPRVVEVAVISDALGLVEMPGGDTVAAFVTMPEVRALIEAVAQWSTGVIGPWPEGVR